MVKPRSQVWQTCFFLAEDELGGEGWDSDPGAVGDWGEELLSEEWWRGMSRRVGRMASLGLSL